MVWSDKFRTNTPIKSIQTGTISFTGASATATISSVDTAKASVRWLGRTNSATSAAQIRDTTVRVELTNSTTVTAFSQSSTGTDIVGYVVEEKV